MFFIVIIIYVLYENRKEKKEARGFTVATPPSAKIHSHPIYTHTHPFSFLIQMVVANLILK